MKKYLLLFSFLSFLFLTGTLSSCGTNKTGCPMNENVGAKANKKGQMPSKRGNSNLFPKDMRKKKN